MRWQILGVCWLAVARPFGLAWLPGSQSDTLPRWSLGSLGLQVPRQLCMLIKRGPCHVCAAMFLGKVFFTTADGALALVCVTDLSESSPFQGVPATMRSPLARPAGVMPAVLLEQTGPPVALLPHALQVCTNLTREELRKCALLCGVSIRLGTRTPTRLSYLTALARHLFEEAEAERVIQMYTTRGRGAHGDRDQHSQGQEDIDLADITDLLLTHTDQDNLAFFQDLKAKAVDKLKGTLLRAPEVQPRGPRENLTPAHLKEHMPGGGSLPGVYIMENVVRKHYVAHYPGARPFQSCSRTWGGRLGRSRKDALEHVLRWQHRQHELAQRAEGQEPHRDHEDRGDHGSPADVDEPPEVKAPPEVQQPCKRRKITPNHGQSRNDSSIGGCGGRPMPPCHTVTQSPCHAQHPAPSSHGPNSMHLILHPNTCRNVACKTTCRQCRRH